MGKDTTYVNRSNTNASLFIEANKELNKYDSNTKQIKAYSEVYQVRKSTLQISANSAKRGPSKTGHFQQEHFKTVGPGCEETGTATKQVDS